MCSGMFGSILSHYIWLTLESISLQKESFTWLLVVEIAVFAHLVHLFLDLC